ncbi:hypothetical protein EDD11_009801 [Mortierella claussenii]|nr:hypothetical protein EDD11_009801 [Mortierella claussenii]
MGGDLRFHMNRRSFGEDVVRFWIAEISSAINHLHSLGIVHRDVKPDNILLDEKGHAHITDFNIGCKLTSEKPFLNSQSGTVAYMAPEVFKGTGYGTSVDWWALGVLFYECMYNQRPFVSENITDLKRAISNQRIEYPAKETISQECVSAIQGFLTRDPMERLGIIGGWNGIRRQPYFLKAAQHAQMSLEEWWFMLETKQLTPEFQPPAEAANFDATYDLEELLLDEDPLTYRSTRKRAQRLQREKEQAQREENARLKAEHDAAMRAALDAEAAMEAMNKKLEEGMRKARNSCSSYSGAFAATTSPPPSLKGSAGPTVHKKKSRLQLFGGDNHNDNNHSDIHHKKDNSHEDRQPSSLQTQPPPIPQPQPQHHHHTMSQLSRQTQFQSIPLSPIDTPNGSRELPTPPVPSLRFPPSPPRDQYFPPPVTPHPSRYSPALQRPLPPSTSPADHHPASYYHHTSTKPPPPDSSSPSSPSKDTKGSTSSSYTYSTHIGLSGYQEPSVVAIDLLTEPRNKAPEQNNGQQDVQPTTSPLITPTKMYRQPSLELIAATATPSTAIIVQQHPFQAALPQNAVSSPVIIPTPLDHSISRHKHIPIQQPQPQPQMSPLLRHQSSQQQLYAQNFGNAHGGGAGPFRRPIPLIPSGAMNIAAAAAAATAMADMTDEEKIAYQMDLIDREFTTFDYTVYESYDGLVDPVTMSVGNPPEWVRSRD